MENIPDYAKAYQEQFWADERAKEAQRRAEKESDPNRWEDILRKLRKPCNGKTLVKYGVMCGCGVYHGGREGTYLVAPDGYRQPVSVHPKDATPGMLNAVRKFIERVVEQRIIAAQSGAAGAGAGPSAQGNLVAA